MQRDFLEWSAGLRPGVFWVVAITGPGRRPALQRHGILLRVRQQVDDDLRQRIGIATHGNRRVGQLAIELESVGFEMRPEIFRRRADDFRQVARLEVVFLLAALHAREIEDVVDKPREPRGFGG